MWQDSKPCLLLLPLALTQRCYVLLKPEGQPKPKPQLSATDISARASMKGAAKCDNHCELQNSVNQWIFERALRSRDIPESMPASVLMM